jgi:hypothetical protein
MVTKDIDLTPEAVAFAMYPKDMRGNYEQRDDFPEYVRMAKVACDMFATRLVEVESLARGTVMSELKPCPFCGSKNLGLIRHTPMQRAPSVMCRDCNCSAISPERWNTRTDSIPSQDDLIIAALEVAAELSNGFSASSHIAQDMKDGIFPSRSDRVDALANAIRALKTNPEALTAIKAKAAEGQAND